jgi:hypothetical protein
MELIHMNVYDPYSNTKPFKELVDEWICDNRPGYIRV